MYDEILKGNDFWNYALALRMGIDVDDDANADIPENLDSYKQLGGGLLLY